MLVTDFKIKDVFNLHNNFIYKLYIHLWYFIVIVFISLKFFISFKKSKSIIDSFLETSLEISSDKEDYFLSPLPNILVISEKNIYTKKWNSLLIPFYDKLLYECIKNINQNNQRIIYHYLEITYSHKEFLMFPIINALKYAKFIENSTPAKKYSSDIKKP